MVVQIQILNKMASLSNQRLPSTTTTAYLKLNHTVQKPQLIAHPKNSRPKPLNNPYATSFPNKASPLVSLSPKGQELGLGKSSSQRKTSWSPKSSSQSGISRPYASSILIPPSSHLRKSTSPPKRNNNSDIRSTLNQKHISQKLSPKISREGSCHEQQPGFLFGPTNAIPAEQSKFQQLAEAVQHYLNGDYQKLLKQDNTENNDSLESGDSILLENANIMDKIQEMQAKQTDRVCIVESIDDVRPVQNISPLGLLSSQRVATVEEQQTQEDLEDEESADRKRQPQQSRILEVQDESSSDESMPEDVSESDHYQTQRNIIPSGSVVGPSSTGEVRSSSKMSTTSGRHNMDIRNVKSRLENLITEQSIDEDSLENLGDENEEHQQSILQQNSMDGSAFLGQTMLGGYNTNFLVGASPPKEAPRYSNPQQIWIYKTFNNEQHTHFKANSYHSRHQQSIVMLVKPEAPKQFNFNTEAGKKCFRDRQVEDITAQRHHKRVTTTLHLAKEPQSTPASGVKTSPVQNGKENTTRPFEMVGKPPSQGKQPSQQMQNKKQHRRTQSQAQFDALFMQALTQQQEEFIRQACKQ
ncbi:hypothetical protein FGO68_gene5925 [Halteria grandinella]|uniref:Uncharacterized protein n=1 Tax=Halteria grandinella TaxID=5974 RepID=A0A8J8NUC9_HALGN|nr:hypothetical protein FGO68_gene5925 [Halteria grandinella]